MIGRRPLTFDLSVRIERRPEEVFALLADVQDAEPIPRRAAVRMTKEPAGSTTIGTRWHERVRILPGYWLRVESVASTVDQPIRLGMDFDSLWFTGHLTYDIEPVPGGCILHQREVLRPRWLLGWMRSFIGRGLRPRLIERLDDIKRLVEASP